MSACPLPTPSSIVCTSTGPSYSLSGRPEPRRIRRSDGPGPGNVNLRQNFASNDAPRVSFLGGAKHKVPLFLSSDSPGPGAYQVRESAVRGTRAASMGKPRTRRSKDPRSMATGAPGGDSPGPGAYSVPSAVGPSAGLSTSFGPRGGPAAAQARSRGGSLRNPRRGSADSARSAASSGGAGGTRSRAGAAGAPSGSSSFGRGRLSFVTNTCSPGPAQYSTRSDPINKQTGKTMAPRLRDLSLKTDTPPPGTYSPRDRISAASAPSITLSPRTAVVPGAGRSTVPGPGTYESMRSLGDSPVYASPGAFSFGGRDPLPVATGSAGAAVGPGSYDAAPPKDTSGVGVTIKGKWPAQRHQERAPGPGAYSPKDPQVSKGGPRLDSSRPSLFTVRDNGTRAGGRLHNTEM
jgi:hypothetical protein